MLIMIRQFFINFLIAYKCNCAYCVEEISKTVLYFKEVKDLLNLYKEDDDEINLNDLEADEEEEDQRKKAGKSKRKKKNVDFVSNYS